MRHRKSGRKLNRTSAHRTAMLRNMVCSLFLTADAAEGKPRRITTTLPKAKEARRLAERCITTAKKALAEEKDAPSKGKHREWHSVHIRRLQAALGRKEAVTCLLEKIAPLYNDRPGGYTRILKLSARRLGDGSDLCYFELVMEPLQAATAAAPAPAEPVAPKKPSAPETAPTPEPAPAADAPQAEA
jgi:large subunit ribosomal protein L17